MGLSRPSAVSLRSAVPLRSFSHDGHKGSFYAIYKDADNAPLATDVVAFRVTFGPNQDNSKTGYGEIELVGYTDVGWKLFVTQPSSLLGSVTISPTSPDGYYAAGTVVTLSLTKTNDVEFVKWVGCISLGRRENAKNYSGFARYKFSGFEIYTIAEFF